MLIKSKRLYDVLKYIQRIGLPALLTLTVTVLKIFGIRTDEITLITGAFITCLGTLLQAEYYVWDKKLEIPMQDDSDT